MSILTTIISLHAEFLATNKAVYQQQVMANQNQEPTIGKDGRLHAPCNNYLWHNIIYSGGEYLAEEGSCAALTTVKFKVETKMIERIQTELTALSPGFGKCWMQDNIEVCYCYLKVPNRIAGSINKLLPVSGKYLELLEIAQEKGLKHGTDFKFNMRKISQIMRSISWEIMLELAGLHTVPVSYVEKKDTWISPLKSQQVCFVYPSDVVC